MSYHRAIDPVCTDAQGSIELVVDAKAKDLGGLSVRRVLPSGKRRMVGPFIFFDHMGPAEFPPGKGIQVRPHPHIGIATVTYLFDGQILHRDDLGFVQPITPGAVNLMTAGRGIVHSERAGDDLDITSRLHGIQSWMALPEDQQECDPDFVHYPNGDLPELEIDGVRVRVIIGTAFERRSPVSTHAPTLYLECRMPAGTSFTLPNDHDEIAAYVVSGSVRSDTQTLTSGMLGIACPGKKLTIEADSHSHAMVIGGANVGERHIWWNFVSTSRARIDMAAQDWREGRFGAVPGETEFIPLPS